MNPYLDVQIGVTKDLIESEPTSIALVRQGEYARTPSGGMARPGGSTTLASKNRFFSAVSGKETFFINEAGERITVQYVLVGPPDDDIEKDDTFALRGMKFRVLYVVPDTLAYETRAMVSRDGR